ncbi:ABC transporter permease [Arthrobacter sp. efr-133-TYG-118]|uniref:ABC transporter permease n=1 Tax=Arthrobacter sp. efr-133-TYG-118 TaxID=3040279 RepID=UPI00254ADF7A|nr:ABC transporter permease [Arthrobacter sp. efr-133-TYG-118]
MKSFVAKRLGQAVLVVFAAYTLSFLLLYVIPGDPVVAMYTGGDAGHAVDPAALQRLREEFGFDRPIFDQYLSRLSGALTGDFGVSLKTGEPVASVMAAALPQTLTLVGLSLVFAVGLGLIVALFGTYTRISWLRQFLLGLPAIGVSLPTFWVGLMLVNLFSFQLRMLPAIGNVGLQSLILPAITLALPGAAAVGQVLAKSMLGTLSEPYVATEKAMGLARRTIHFRDVFRSAAIPAVTVTGVLVANLIGGSVVVESVFSRSGIGQITVQAVLAHDLPVVQAVVVLGAVIFVVVSLIVDLLYPLLDPRLRTAIVKG